MLANAPGRLSPAQIAEALRSFGRLRFHPRDDLPNVAALAEGNALYADLKGAERAELGQRIAEFCAILESQDPAQVADARETLLQWIRAARQGVESALN